tara:strand:+ start:1528 stop:2475 length:948 start_codon:yes stop_codon:yes gene_type:complete
VRYRKSQEGLVIAGFALATVMIIALLVTFLSNRVIDMIATQNQVFFSKQAYWNSFSGMEIVTSKKIAGLEDKPSAAVSFATGSITIIPTTVPNNYLGGNKVSTITSTGSDAGGRSRAIKLEVGNPSSNYVLSFDGADDYVDIGDITGSSNIVDGIKTISFWMQADDITSHTDYLIDLNGDDYIIKEDAEVTISLGSPTYYVNAVSGEQTIAAVDTWYHVVIKTSTGIPPSDVDIGRLESTGFFDGVIDEVALWSVELTDDQIKTLYIQGLGFLATNIANANLVGFWNFNDTVDPTVGLSSNSNTGSIEGATYTGS